MTSQERFYRCYHYQPVDHVVDMEFGYWDEIHVLWQKDGLPPGLDTHEKLELYFGLEGRKHTFEEVGQKMSMTKMGAKKLIDRTLVKMKKEMK